MTASTSAKPMVRALRDVRAADAATVGGKAASLGELMATGVRVPDGIVLTVDGATPPLDLALDELGPGPFAVRSSGIAEDGSDRSFAGVFESLLDVSRPDVPAAVQRVLASGSAQRVAGYAGTDHQRLAVIVQQMVDARSAGVALTADPITGSRDRTVITAVRGTGDRLVSGEAIGDEWEVAGGTAIARRQLERAIDAKLARAVATQARAIATARGAPQDIEWAVDEAGTVWIVQARPMTGLPPAVSWASPARGAYTRQLRFGEWIGEPVTPLFESWLLSRMEERLHEELGAWTGQGAPRPHHVIVNGWYFYSLNWLTASSPRDLLSLLKHAFTAPRRVSAMFPPTVRFGIALFEREWREDLQPRYQAAVADAVGRVESVAVEELPALIDDLADHAGRYFASVAALAGAAYKMEMNLARFYRKHLAGAPGDSHLPLVSGVELPADEQPSLVSLDWWFEPMPSTASPPDHARVIVARKAAEAAAISKLAGSPRRLRAFQRLLSLTQHVGRIREEQMREFTRPWPTMRRAVSRIGETLVARGVLASVDDVFFLTRAEALDALRAGDTPGRIDVEPRRLLREEQARLVPPNLVGRLNPILRRIWATFPKLVGAVKTETAIVSGSPASAGRATGTVRVIRHPRDAEQLLAGEILVAPVTAPAWTPLFARAAAVVTDIGSAAAHASIIAREYGIPAVVGCGDATSRLRTGMLVTVDGSTGNVEPA